MVMQSDSFGPPEPADRSVLTGFGVNRLDRMSARRDDAAFIEELRRDEGSRTLILSGDIALLKRDSEGYDPLFTGLEAAALGKTSETAFLGCSGDAALFATLIDDAAAELAEAREDIVALDLRAIALQNLVPIEILGAMGQAKSLMYWHARHRFCANCGAPSNVSAAGWRRTCGVCASQHFPRTDPVVMMLVIEGDACLLGRGGNYPEGIFSCLAGYVESGETLEDAVRRETSEEVGVSLGKIAYFASQPWPFPASLMVGYIAHARARDLTIDASELDDARWFERGEVKLMLDGAHPGALSCPPKLTLANLLIRAWARGEGC
jgi:NAD+ diphosphatase